MDVGLGLVVLIVGVFLQIQGQTDHYITADGDSNSGVDGNRGRI